MYYYRVVNNNNIAVAYITDIRPINETNYIAITEAEYTQSVAEMRASFLPDIAQEE